MKPSRAILGTPDKRNFQLRKQHIQQLSAMHGAGFGLDSIPHYVNM